MRIKILVCGSRYYSSYSKVLDYLRTFEYADVLVVSGSAEGASCFTVQACSECKFPSAEYPAVEYPTPRGKCGKKAGTVRNHKTLICEKPDLEESSAEWDKYGRETRKLINQKMLVCEKPDLVVDMVVAYQTEIERCKGTKYIVFRARKSGVPVVVIE